MGWFDWFTSIGSAFRGLLGALLNSVGVGRTGKLLFLGLDNAGKTTLFQMLRDDRLGSNQPTQRPTKEQFAIGNMTFEAFDLGGHEAARAIWADYLVDVTAVVFVVDATDRERLGNASYELHQLLGSELLVGVPFVILGNKVDLGTACSEMEIRHVLGLEGTSGKDTNAHELREMGIRPMEVFMCSVVRRSGYGDAFRWLTKYV